MKILIDLKHNDCSDTTRGTMEIIPGDRIKQLLEIMDGIDPEHVKQVFRTIGGFLGISSEEKESGSEVNIEGDEDDNNTDSGPSPDRAANLV